MRLNLKLFIRVSMNILLCRLKFNFFISYLFVFYRCIEGIDATMIVFCLHFYPPTKPLKKVPPKRPGSPLRGTARQKTRLKINE